MFAAGRCGQRPLRMIFFFVHITKINHIFDNFGQTQGLPLRVHGGMSANVLFYKLPATLSAALITATFALWKLSPPWSQTA